MNAIAELQVKVDTAVDPLERTRALRHLATMLARHGRFERSLEYARQAVEIASRECDVVAADEARLSQVGCHVFAKEFLAALELALEVAERSKHRDDFRLAAQALASAGVCEHQLGATEEADSSLTQAIALAERCGTDALGATGCCALGRKLLIAHRFDEAEEWLRKGLALVDSRDCETRCQILVELSGILSNRGTTLLEVDPEWGIANVQEALERLRLARAEAVSADSRYWEGNCVLGAGVNLFTLQRYEESKRSICEALDIAMTLGESIQIAASRFHLGRLQLHLGEYRDAIDQLTHVSAMVPDLGSRSYFPADACRLLSDAYEKVGDLPNALRFLRQHQRMLADINLDANAQAVRAMRQHAFRLSGEFRERAVQLEEEQLALQSKSEALANEARTDPLTGLLNRRGFETRMRELKSQYDCNATSAAVIVIDIDHFKTINDCHSHGVGDQVLETVGDLIRRSCRAGDLAVRNGGDEFVLVLAGVSWPDAQDILQRLRRRVGDFNWEAISPGLRPTMSIGVVVRPLADTPTLLAEADRAMYVAKRTGGNRIHFEDAKSKL